MSTVLVVDDMPIFRDPIAASLRLAGYKTVCAATGAEALAAARARRPDVVLLDVSMPGMDGISCLRAVRADPSLADLPVILLTAVSDRQYVLEAGKLGVKDYLLKSRFSLADLLARVAKYAPPAVVSRSA
jgi:CheY-like chemotaxis protein